MFSGALGHHFLPADGDWTRAEWWRSVMQECAAPEVALVAEEALLRVFSPEWARDLVASEEPPHPFEWLWKQRGGVPQLLKLGHSLVLLNSPKQIIADIRERSRFETRTSEAWAGAFMRAHGATVHYLENRDLDDPEVAFMATSGPIPEFVAVLDDSRFAVEVKHLDMGAIEKAYMAVSSAFEDGFFRGEFEAGLPRSLKGSAALLTFPPAVLEALEGDDIECAKKTAAECSHALGRLRIEFLRTDPPDGEHDLAPGLKVLVGSQYNGGWQGSFPFPKLQTYLDRLTRNQLRDSARKFESCGSPGVVVLLRPWWPKWPPPIIEAVGEILARRKRLARVAAVMFVDEPHEPGMRWLADQVHVLPGPAWEDLPRSLKCRLPACDGCGRRHRTFELSRASAP